MRRRLYFMLPDVRSARSLLDKLLLARIEERHMHFCARDGALLSDMPEANFLQKTDIVQGAELGMLVGGCAGMFAGMLLVWFPPDGLHIQSIAILVAALGGALFGAWASGMAAAAAPSSRLKSFADGIEHGQVLLMLDVPFRRIDEIENLVLQRHPDAKFGGIEPHIPVFP
jgi:hypothetical protein